MDNRIFPERAIIKTKNGEFHLKITINKDRNTNQPHSYSVNLGSRTTKCIQMDVPSIKNESKYGYLIWVKKNENKENDCALEIYNETNLTQFMVLLGLTIARDINPTLQGMRLKDDSGFDCDLPNNKTWKVSMREMYIAFHKKSWYEEFFNAKMIHNYNDYILLKKNFNNETKKPQYFNFINDDLNELLTPIYNSTNTWDEFFQELSKIYGKNKCAVVYPWVNHALDFVFENKSYHEQTLWVINFEENIKTPLIPFESYIDNVKYGGHRKTRRKNNYKKIFYGRNIPEIMNFQYKKFL